VSCGLPISETTLRVFGINVEAVVVSAKDVRDVVMDERHRS